jgi:hypothetical protein
MEAGRPPESTRRPPSPAPAKLEAGLDNVEHAPPPVLRRTTPLAEWANRAARSIADNLNRNVTLEDEAGISPPP